MELEFKVSLPVKLQCDDLVVIHISFNVVDKEHTKHISAGCYVVKERVAAKEVTCVMT